MLLNSLMIGFSLPPDSLIISNPGKHCLVLELYIENPLARRIAGTAHETDPDCIHARFFLRVVDQWDRTVLHADATRCKEPGFGGSIIGLAAVIFRKVSQVNSH